MPTGLQLVVPIVNRGLRWQLVGLGLSLALALLVAAPAREHRLYAGLLFLVGVGVVSNAWGLRANGALLALAQPPRPSWIPWVSGLAFAAGGALALCGLLFIWHARAAP